MSFWKYNQPYNQPPSQIQAANSAVRKAFRPPAMPITMRNVGATSSTLSRQIIVHGHDTRRAHATQNNMIKVSEHNQSHRGHASGQVNIYVQENNIIAQQCSQVHHKLLNQGHLRGMVPRKKVSNGCVGKYRNGQSQQCCVNPLHMDVMPGEGQGTSVPNGPVRGQSQQYVQNPLHTNVVQVQGQGTAVPNGSVQGESQQGVRNPSPTNVVHGQGTPVPNGPVQGKSQQYVQNPLHTNVVEVQGQGTVAPNGPVQGQLQQSVQNPSHTNVGMGQGTSQCMHGGQLNETTKRKINVFQPQQLLYQNTQQIQGNAPMQFPRIPYTDMKYQQPIIYHNNGTGTGLHALPTPSPEVASNSSNPLIESGNGTTDKECDCECLCAAKGRECEKMLKHLCSWIAEAMIQQQVFKFPDQPQPKPAEMDSEQPMQPTRDATNQCQASYQDPHISPKPQEMSPRRNASPRPELVQIAQLSRPYLSSQTPAHPHPMSMVLRGVDEAIQTQYGQVIRTMQNKYGLSTRKNERTADPEAEAVNSVGENRTKYIGAKLANLSIADGTTNQDVVCNNNATGSSNELPPPTKKQRNVANKKKRTEAVVNNSQSPPCLQRQSQQQQPGQEQKQRQQKLQKLQQKQRQQLQREQLKQQQQQHQQEQQHLQHDQLRQQREQHKEQQMQQKLLQELHQQRTNDHEKATLAADTSPKVGVFIPPPEHQRLMRPKEIILQVEKQIKEARIKERDAEGCKSHKRSLETNSTGERLQDDVAESVINSIKPYVERIPRNKQKRFVPTNKNVEPLVYTDIFHHLVSKYRHAPPPKKRYIRKYAMMETQPIDLTNSNSHTQHVNRVEKAHYSYSDQRVNSLREPTFEESINSRQLGDSTTVGNSNDGNDDGASTSTFISL